MSAPFPTTGAMADAILATHGRSTEEQRKDGRAWYPTAREVCQGIADGRVPVDRVAAVVSALSPRCSWKLNLVWAHRVVEAHVAGQVEPPAVSTRVNRAKAWSAIRGQTVTFGLKTASFVANIMGNLDEVTVDAWAMRAASVDRPGGTLTPLQYGRITDAYRAAATIVGEKPADMQAICWIVMRGGGD